MRSNGTLRTQDYARYAVTAAFLGVLLMIILGVLLASEEEAARAFEPFMLVKSFLLSASGALLGLGFAFPLAFAAASATGRSARLLLAAAAAGLVIPPYVSCYAYEYFFWDTLGISLGGYWGCIFLFAVTTWPVEALCITAAIRKEASALNDCARQFAGPWKRFFGVTLPMVAPGAAVGAGLSFILSFSYFTIPLRFGVSTLSTRIAERLSMDYDLSVTGVYLAPYVLGLGVVVFALRLFAGRYNYSSSPLFSGRGSFRPSIWPWIPAVSGITLSVVIPLFVLAGDFTFEGLGQVLGMFGGEILSSVLFAAVSAFLVSAAGFWCAFWRIEKKSGSWSAGMGAALLAFALSGFFTAVGVKRVFSLSGLNVVVPGVLVVVAAYFVKFFFIGGAGASLGLGGSNRRFEEAAATLGAGPVKRLLAVALPLSARALLAVWCLVFVLVLCEYEIAFMLAPPSWQTAAMSLHNQMHYDYSELTSAFSLVMVLIGGLPLALYFIFGPRYGEARG